MDKIERGGVLISSCENLNPLEGVAMFSVGGAERRIERPYMHDLPPPMKVILAKRPCISVIYF